MVGEQGGGREGEETAAAAAAFYNIAKHFYR